MRLPACPSKLFNKKHDSHRVVVICGTTVAFIFLILLFSFLVLRCHQKGSRRKSPNSSPTNDQNEKVSYGELGRATNGFSEDNIIESGSSGTVYKGLLNGGKYESCCYKGIKPSNTRSIKEINGRMRSSGKHSALISFQDPYNMFMENGSLDDWLRPKANEQFKARKLHLMGRLNIAIDVADALDYLHHHCGKPIVHRDLKPSNNLLDDNMIAHVGGVGLAKFLKKVTSQYSTSSAGLKGTIGYIALEYRMGNQVSSCWDVHSYGILLLERDPQMICL